MTEKELRDTIANMIAAGVISDEDLWDVADKINTIFEKYYREAGMPELRGMTDEEIEKAYPRQYWEAKLRSEGWMSPDEISRHERERLELLLKCEDTPPEITKLINKHFWKLV